MELRVYEGGENWTIREILAHFISIENAFGLMIKDVLAGGPGAPDDFDIDRFNAREVRAASGISNPALLRSFSDARTRTIQRLATLEPGDLDRKGRHPWFGDLTLHAMFKWIYRHNLLHIRDIRRALKNTLPAQD